MDKSLVKSGAMAQQNKTTPTAAIRSTRGLLGSVNHQATTADRRRRVGIKKVDATHDISVWCGRRGGREEEEEEA